MKTTIKCGHIDVAVELTDLTMQDCLGWRGGADFCCVASFFDSGEE